MVEPDLAWHRRSHRLRNLHHHRHGDCRPEISSLFHPQCPAVGILDSPFRLVWASSRRAACSGPTAAPPSPVPADVLKHTYTAHVPTANATCSTPPAGISALTGPHSSSSGFLLFFSFAGFASPRKRTT